MLFWRAISYLSGKKNHASYVWDNKSEIWDKSKWLDYKFSLLFCTYYCYQKERKQWFMLFSFFYLVEMVFHRWIHTNWKHNILYGQIYVDTWPSHPLGLGSDQEWTQQFQFKLGNGIQQLQKLNWKWIGVSGGNINFRLPVVTYIWIFQY